jgi:hypothetical protein
MRTFSRLLSTAVFCALLASCGGLKEKTLARAGKKGFWRVEKTRTTSLWAWLSRLKLMSSIIKDTGYQGERWWFVSPAGNKTFLRAVNGAVPDSRDADPAAFLPAAARNLSGWGFNSFGYGVDVGAWVPVGPQMPAVVSLSLDKWGAGMMQGVFEPACAQSAAKACEFLAGPLMKSRNAVGILWEYPGRITPRDILLAYAAMRPETASKNRLVAWIKERCREPGSLQARMPSVRDFDELLGLQEWDQYELIDADAEGFAALVMAAYASQVKAEMRDRLGEYVCLGPLLSLDLPTSVIKAVADQVDVLTFSVSTADGRLPRRRLEDIYAETGGKPILLLDSGQRLARGSGPAVETADGQAASYRRLATAAAGLPFVAGLGWTAYRDSPDEGWGLLDGAGAPREPLVKAATEANALLDGLHKSGLAPEMSATCYSEDRFAGAGRPVRGVGRLPAGVRIDGDLTDWPAAWPSFPDFQMAKDLDPAPIATISAGWTDKGLVFAVKVTADSASLVRPEAYWRGSDFVEILLDGSGAHPEGYTPAVLHLVVLPRGGGADGRGALAMAIHHQGDALAADERDCKAVQAGSSVARDARTVAEPGAPWPPRVRLAQPFWAVEVLVPWKVLKLDAPKAETRVGFNAVVRRVSGPRPDEMFWASPRGESGLDHPSTWGDLVLKEKPE